jgi:hypothetical protein
MKLSQLVRKLSPNLAGTKLIIKMREGKLISVKPCLRLHCAVEDSRLLWWIEGVGLSTPRLPTPLTAARYWRIFIEG